MKNQSVQSCKDLFKNIPVSLNNLHYLGIDPGADDMLALINLLLTYEKLNIQQLKLNSSPKSTISGNQITADSLLNSDNNLTLISTSSLTTMALAFSEIELHAKQGNTPSKVYFEKISAVIVMGGVYDASVANAPFTATNKDAEANWFFDAEATRLVINTCKKYHIPFIHVPLDLTTQASVLWRPREIQQLRNLKSFAAQQVARITTKVPTNDAKHYPPGSQPAHDLHVTNLLFRPEDYACEQVNFNIGGHGEIIPLNNPANSSQFRVKRSARSQTPFWEKNIKLYHALETSGQTKALANVTATHMPEAQIDVIAEDWPLILGTGAALLLCLAYFIKKIKNGCRDDDEHMPLIGLPGPV